MSRPDTSIYQGVGNWPTIQQRRQQDIALEDQRAQADLRKVQAEEQRQNAERLRMELEQRRSEYNEGQALKDVVLSKKQAGQDITVDDIIGAAPLNGMKWADAYVKNVDAQTKAAKAQLDNVTEKHKMITSHLGALRGLPAEQRQAAHDKWILANASWLGDQAQTMRNEGLTDSELAAAAAEGLTYEQQLTEAHKAADEKLKQADADAKRLGELAKTVVTEQGVMQLNPQTGRYDIKVGDRPGPQAQAPMSPERYEQEKNLSNIRKQGAPNLSPYSESNIVNRLTQRWDSQSKIAVELNRQVSLMDAGITAARRGDLAQGSQAVLVTFQKILDPTSVVRESEYARSGEGQALLARIQGAYEKLSQGGAGVPLPELEKYATLAKEMAKQSNSHLNVIKSQIDKTASRYNIPQELVTTEDLTPAPPKTQAGPKVGAEEGGYIFMGGNPADPKSWKKKK